ncbi:MAG: SPOR domain-containing protein [SAR324 cluster bacterium]|nr:SPOR domain-containing protein [SAR324 cluster bacterium]MBL7035016.1 SPOR domain-containing protein [SAR324 cluster bacterium]
MPDSQAKKVFRIQLSVSIVLLLFTLSGLSLAAAFYLGVISGKSMQRPPENSAAGTDISAEKPMSADELKFFGLGERKKDQDTLDLEELRNLKKKTKELTKAPQSPSSALPQRPKADPPEALVSESPAVEQKTVTKKTVTIPVSKSPKSPQVVKSPVAQSKKEVAYTIQVLASRKQANAKKLVEKLKKNGFEQAFIYKHTAGSKTLYRVRVGNLNRSGAKKLADQLKKLKFIDSVHVTRF